MIRKVLLIIMALSAVVSFRANGQTRTECLKIMKRADSAIERRNYNFALTKLRAYKICSPGASKEADEKIIDVFNRIEAEKKAADSARREAVKQTMIAVSQKKAALEAKAISDRQTYLAQLSALSANSMLLAKQDPTLAFRLATLAYQKSPTREHSGVVHSIISDTTNSFYKLKVDGYYKSYVFNDEEDILYCTNGLYLKQYSASGQLKQVNVFEIEDPYCSAISPSGKYTFTGSESKLMIYRNKDFSFKAKKWEGPVFSEARWSNDGVYIYLSNLVQGDVYVLDSNLNTVFRFSEKNIMSFDFAPNLEYFAVGSISSVVIRDTKAGSDADTIPEDGASLVRFNMNGQRLYTSGFNGKEIKIWTLEDGKHVSTTFERHVSKIKSISFSSCGYNLNTLKDTILSSSDDGVSILWESSGKVIKVLRNLPGVIDDERAAVFSNQAQKVITSTSRELYLWNVQNNLLSTINIPYPDLMLVDISSEARILKDHSKGYYLKTGNAIDTFKVSFEDPIIDMSFVDKNGDILLLQYNDRVILLNRILKIQKVLVNNGDKLIRSFVDGLSNILLYTGKEMFLFNKNGAIVFKRKFSEFINSSCIVDGTKMYSVTPERAYLIEAKSNDTLRTWNIPDPFRGDAIDKLTISPDRNFILAGTANRAFLFDTAWRLIKHYDDIGNGKAWFSQTGDSIYFSTFSKVAVRYSFAGLSNSKEISQISIRDNLKYNVPGFLNEIVKRENWPEYDLCVLYLYRDYLSTENEGNITSLDYLYSQSSRFYQPNRNYFLHLEERIELFDDILKNRHVAGFATLKNTLSKIRDKLMSERRILKKMFGELIETDKSNKKM